MKGAAECVEEIHIHPSWLGPSQRAFMALHRDMGQPDPAPRGVQGRGEQDHPGLGGFPHQGWQWGILQVCNP